jgi:hypothetical protein
MISRSWTLGPRRAILSQGILPSLPETATQAALLKRNFALSKYAGVRKIAQGVSNNYERIAALVGAEKASTALDQAVQAVDRAASEYEGAEMDLNRVRIVSGISSV